MSLVCQFSGSLQGAILSYRRHVAVSRDVFGCQNVYLWMEAVGAAKHSKYTGQSSTPSPWNYPIWKVTCAEVKNSFIRGWCV